MSYINANEILPKELISEIQKYVNGVNLYIPKLPEKKKSDNRYRQEIRLLMTCFRKWWEKIIYVRITGNILVK